MSDVERYERERFALDESSPDVWLEAGAHTIWSHKDVTLDEHAVRSKQIELFAFALYELSRY